MSYFKESMRTRSGNYYECDHDIEHGIIGLTTEASELLEALVLSDPETDMDIVNVLEECGDLCWYLAILCFGYKWEFSDLDIFDDSEKPDGQETVISSCIDFINVTAGKLLDGLKKCHYYGVELNEKDNKLLAQSIHSAICTICQVCDTDIESVKLTNIKKLKARYPDKWTKETAVNRDLVNERSILESDTSS